MKMTGEYYIEHDLQVLGKRLEMGRYRSFKQNSLKDIYNVTHIENYYLDNTATIDCILIRTKSINVKL